MDQIEVQGGLRRTLELTRSITSELAVILVNNVRGETLVRNDYDTYSVATSFLHDFEINDIILALESFGVYVVHFSDEVDFLRWALNGGYASAPRRRKLVYSSAVNGSGAGRKSLIPAFCALERIPTVNSNAYAASLSRHKFHWTKLLQSFGLPVPRTWLYDVDDGWFMNEAPPLGTLVIGKATFEGGSLGLAQDTIGTFSRGLEASVSALGKKLRQPITVQEFIVGVEVEVPIVNIGESNRPLDAIKLSKGDGTSLEHAVLTYAEMWDDAYRFERADLEPALSSELRATAKVASTIFPLTGFGRVDFRIDKNGMPYIIDIASTPHLTERSSLAFAFSEMGFTYRDMLLLLFGLAASRHDWFHSSLQS